MMTYHVQFLLLVLAGWVNRQQQDVIDYQQEENRVLRAGLRGKRLSLSDDERRRLAVKAQALGREALAQIASVATPANPLQACALALLPPQIRDCGQAQLTRITMTEPAPSTVLFSACFRNSRSFISIDYAFPSKANTMDHFHRLVTTGCGEYLPSFPRPGSRSRRRVDDTKQPSMAGLNRAINAGSTFCGAHRSERKIIRCLKRFLARENYQRVMTYYQARQADT